MIKFIEENKSIDTTFVTETYFFHENEDLTSFFYSEIKSNNYFIITEITKNQYNNKIGFYQFFIDKNKYIKIYIFPKTVSINIYTGKEELIEFFNIYFKEYLRLKKKYHIDKGYKEVKDNILDIDLNNASIIEEYIISKYRKSLIEIINFFKKHNKEVITSKNFFSQDITSSLDIKKNVFEINKSKIHQREDMILNYSKIAEISLGVIKIFSNLKIPFFNNSELTNEVKSLNNLLKKVIKNRYIFNQNISSRAKIQKNINSKVFNNNSKLLALKSNLIFLLGWETPNSNIKINNIDSIWFSTEYMYELRVLEYLENLKISKKFNLLTKATKNYNVLIDGEIQGSINSIPDFIVVSEDTLYIIDAKWKIIDDTNSIKFLDILKAHRDSIVHNKDYKKLKIIIFYPLIYMDKSIYSGKNITYDYEESPNFQIHELQLLKSNNIPEESCNWF